MAYKPPQQSGIRQVVDSLLILVVLFICLLAPFRWDAIVAALAPTAETVAVEVAKAPDAPWESLKQTPVQAQ